ncbi:hypothetical protein AAVH_21508 [Aphelenchoides avenae]|nr:hypothetical protein AAVH_21508 [Aphelenchus avenae]
MRAPVTEVNVELLITLADRFQVVWLVADCEDLLLTSNRFTVAEKLIISTRLNLDELQKKCLDDLTLEDVDMLIDMDEESAMGVKVDGRLLQKLLGKQKELIEAKHERAMKARKDDH